MNSVAQDVSPRSCKEILCIKNMKYLKKSVCLLSVFKYLTSFKTFDIVTLFVHKIYIQYTVFIHFQNGTKFVFLCVFPVCSEPRSYMG